jgi:hypothetical protein
MRDQYAGDVHDYFKFALLRRLATTSKTLGVCWYYVPESDNPFNGRHVDWWKEDGWDALDPVLSEALSNLPTRTIAALEASGVWPPGVIFHNVPIPSSIGRLAWAAHKRTSLEAANLIFLDPDNGVGETLRHASLSEIKLLRRSDRTILFITFPPRSKDALRKLHSALEIDCGVNRIQTLKICAMLPRRDASGRTPSIRWFTVVDPDELVAIALTDFLGALNKLPNVKADLVS